MGDIGLIGVDGKNARRLIETPNLSEGSPEWSPDGRTLVYCLGWEFDDAYAKREEIWTVDIETGKRRSLGLKGRCPMFSPDGKTIAFVSEGDLCVANADGSGQRVISKGKPPRKAWLPGWTPWSPDSTMLTYADNRGLWIFEAATGKGRLLLEKPGEHACWSTEPNKIFYDGAKQSIWLIELGGDE